jgi:hypothetical protein
MLLSPNATAVTAGRLRERISARSDLHGYGTAPFSDKVYREF